MAQARTMQENATLSENEEPQWNHQEIPPLWGGSRHRHASIVVEDPENEEEQSIVVLGGREYSPYSPYSEPSPVSVLNVGQKTKEWRSDGPEMNEKRYEHVAVICNGSVYAIGGASGKYSQGTGKRGLNSIECIRVADLLETASKANESPGRHLMLECP